MFKRIREFAARVGGWAPNSPAHGTERRPFIGVDEGLGSTLVWAFVKEMVGKGIASGGSTLWTEMYLHADGRIATVPDAAGVLRVDLDALRKDPSLRRMPSPDRTIVEHILARLVTNRALVVLSADLGQQADGLRMILARDVAPVIDRQREHMGLTLILKSGATSEHDFIEETRRRFFARAWPDGFHELVI